MHRVRPEDEASDDGNSDDIVSDEELQVSSDQLIDALTTRIGGKTRTEDSADAEARQGGATHYENSRSAMNLAQDVWHTDTSMEGRKAP